MRTGTTDLVSAVIIAYNGEAFLGQAIDSVLAQDHEPVEVIVVDDGSADGTARIASERPVRLVSRPNGGMAAARNTGIEAARGEFVAFLDHDDLWTPEKLSRQVAHLRRHAGLGAVLCRMENFLEPGGAAPAGFKPEWLAAPQPAYIPSALLVRRWMLDRVGGFDTSFEHGSDSDWLARAKDAGMPADVLDDVLLRRRIHGTNMSNDVGGLRRDLMRVLRGSVQRQRASDQR